MEETILEVNGMIDHYGWQRSNIRYFLNKNKGKRVRCKVNSWGGSVNEAIAISKIFEEHGNVVVEFIGFCASAVTWMAFGAQSREMHEDSLWLCHKSSIPVELYGQMNADQLDAAITQLENEKKSQEAIDLIIAKKYAEMCVSKGKTIKDVFDLMKQERWIPAEDVLAWGFIDNVIPGINKVTNEYRNLMIENCATLNFPVPVFQQPEDKGEDLADKIINGIKSIFENGKKNKENKTNPNTNLKNNSVMNKTFIAVNTLLAIEGLTVNEEKIELTTDQLQKICDALKVADNNKQAVDDAETVLNSMSDNIKSITGLTNKINAVKAVINLIPSGAPAGTQLPPKAPSVDFSDSKKDPVNDYFKED